MFFIEKNIVSSLVWYCISFVNELLIINYCFMREMDRLFYTKNKIMTKNVNNKL